MQSSFKKEDPFYLTPEDFFFIPRSLKEQRRMHRKWLALTAIIPGISLIFLDQGILPVALPVIQKSLEASNTALWWCVNAYLLASGVFLLAGGALGDRIGHRKVFLWGMIFFTLSSVLCGCSTHVYELIFSRTIQGLAASLMIPSSSSLIMMVFPQKERGKAIGINVSIGSLFLIASPFIGGYLTQVFSWRWIFWVNLPVACIGILLIVLFLPPSPKGRRKIDIPSFSYFVLASSFSIIALMQSGEFDGGSPENLIFIVGGAIGWVCFIIREKTTKNGLIDRELFRHPVYRAVCIAVFSTQFVLMITIYRTVFFQEAFGWSPLKTGFVAFISSSPVLFMAPVAGRLADKTTSKLPITIGFLLLIFSFFWLSFQVRNSLPILFTGLFAFGIGIPLIFTPSYSSAMGSISFKKSGAAFGLLSMIRSLSAALSIALIGSFSAYVQQHFFIRRMTANPDTNRLDFSVIEGLAKGSEKLKTGLSTEQLSYVESYRRASEIRSFALSHLIMALLLIAAFILVFIFYGRKSSHLPPEGPAEGWD